MGESYHAIRAGGSPEISRWWSEPQASATTGLYHDIDAAASWMVNNLVEARGGLHNRVTGKIRLLPFTLGETRAFLRSRGVDLTDYQIIELFMALGGVPHYLKMAQPGWSMAQIIDRTCFQPQGELRTKFDKLYASLFDKPEEHLAIVKSLAKKNCGLTRTELLAAAGLPSGGTASGRLDELAESGFIQMTVPFGKREKDALIRLADEFSLFHHAWTMPMPENWWPIRCWQMSCFRN